MLLMLEQVASTGIEPVSGASETLILSIVLRGQNAFSHKKEGKANVFDLNYKNYRLRLLLNIFTAIARRMTPKNLRTTIRPALPSILSIKLRERSTT